MSRGKEQLIRLEAEALQDRLLKKMKDRISPEIPEIAGHEYKTLAIALEGDDPGQQSVPDSIRKLGTTPISSQLDGKSGSNIDRRHSGAKLSLRPLGEHAGKNHDSHYYRYYRGRTTTMPLFPVT